MGIRTKILAAWSLAALAGMTAATASAQDKLLNLYSSRHYQTDEALYSNFTKQTAIRLRRIEAGEDPLIERLRNEGAKSPADVLVTVDAGRLWRAEQLGLFAPVDSKVLETRLPDHMRTPNKQWFGFSARARVIVYNKDSETPNIAEIIIGKNRHGAIGTVETHFEGRFTRFENLSQRSDAPGGGH